MEWWNRHTFFEISPRTYGSVIENTTTRTRFCCRSSFVFADRRLPGFDPTTTRVPGDPTQFTTVRSHDNEKPRKFCLGKRTSFDLDL
ncbi:hypothetical protein BS47DRAFT_1349035 [Hydnum rufescens UP504]|uniref:Uncharacterized protein n=1 Tax=Hydnum rufescens UP504 TaxID=1448309 RepID=A0A9P6DQ00_9AGAM|nr:hypothetical protein BS47DRAFT_1350400 [Hydnum rufescens UP504]KAF9509527.1 hypothetical protein BS47DRAFT_1349035 [Hydnum rufescens UP504]